MDNIWLLLGPEIGIKRQKINTIISHIKTSTQSKEEVETIKFFASDTETKTIAYEIQTQSLFATIRIICIEQIDMWVTSDIKTIAEAIKSKDPNTTIIFCSDSTKVSVILEKTIPQSNKIIFWHLSEKDYYTHIRKKATQMHITIQEDAVESLVYLAADSTLELDNLLEQISIFKTKSNEDITKIDPSLNENKSTTPNNAIIEKKDIEKWISYHKQETVFKIVEEIALSKYEAAFLVLDSLLHSGSSPSQLIAGITFQIKNALRLKQRIDAGEYPKNILLSLNIRGSTFQQTYIDFVANRTLKTFQTMLILCAETEESLRTGGGSRYQKIMMTMLIYRVCMLHHNAHYQPFTDKTESHYNVSNIYLQDW